MSHELLFWFYHVNCYCKILCYLYLLQVGLQWCILKYTIYSFKFSLNALNVLFFVGWFGTTMCRDHDWNHQQPNCLSVPHSSQGIWTDSSREEMCWVARKKTFLFSISFPSQGNQVCLLGQVHLICTPTLPCPITTLHSSSLNCSPWTLFCWQIHKLFQAMNSLILEAWPFWPQEFC